MSSPEDIVQTSGLYSPPGEAPKIITIERYDPYIDCYLISEDETVYRWLIAMLINKHYTPFIVNERTNNFYGCTCGAVKTKQPGHSYWCDIGRPIESRD